MLSAGPSSPHMIYSQSNTNGFDGLLPELQGILPEREPDQSSWGSLLQSSLDVILGDFGSSVQNTEDSDESDKVTTLCSIAYRLAFQCNKRGLGDVELNVRMQHGFRPGRNSTEGCRVDNRVLLSVLSEISK
jgi:hypothetical protein